MVTRVLGDGVLTATLQEGDQRPSESSEASAALDTRSQSEIQRLQQDAEENWARFVYGAREMKTGAGQLLRILRRWLAWFLARCAAHCIQFLTTTVPTWARLTWHQTKSMIRKRHKSVTTWASVTLTARHPRP